MPDADSGRRAYRRLLALYPKDFRERVGPSMEQTFADNLRERRDSGAHVIAFILWAYAETTLGMMKERLRRQRRSSLIAVVAGLVLVVPLMILEWANRSNLPRSTFAFPLFVLMWIMVVLFTRTFIGAVRSGRALLQGHAASRSISLVPRIAFMGWIAWVWVMSVIDQWPCFLGAAGC